MKSNKLAAEQNIKDFLENLGFDPENDPHMRDTPKRVVKLFTEELFKGCYEEPPNITVFDTGNGGQEEDFVTEQIDTNYGQMIFSGPIKVRSTCSHHLLPIDGYAYVAILLNNNGRTVLPGLSKYARIVHHFASQPQVQERLTEQVANHLEETLDLLGVGVCVQAKHFCMCHRGVHEPDSDMITTELRGVFREERVRLEFFQYINMTKWRR